MMMMAVISALDWTGSEVKERSKHNTRELPCSPNSRDAEGMAVFFPWALRLQRRDRKEKLV